jgi:hypothetical protein
MVKVCLKIYICPIIRYGGSSLLGILRIYPSVFIQNQQTIKETTNNTKHPKKNENYNEILEKPFIFNL